MFKKKKHITIPKLHDEIIEETKHLIEKCTPEEQTKYVDDLVKKTIKDKKLFKKCWELLDFNINLVLGEEAFRTFNECMVSTLLLLKKSREYGIKYFLKGNDLEVAFYAMALFLRTYTANKQLQEKPLGVV